MKSLLILLAFLALVLTDARAVAHDSDPVALAQRLQFELAGAVDGAQRAGSEIDPAMLARIAAEIDAGIEQWMRSGGRIEATRKLAELRGLLGNGRRYNELRQQRMAASLPYTELAPGQPMRAAGPQDVGGDCAFPADLDVGRPLATTLAPAGSAGDSFWLRVAPAAGNRAVSTLGSQGDVDIAVYAGCADAQPLLLNDDYYGLQALAVLPAQARASVLVRIGNRDRNRPVPARIEVVLATGFSGDVTVDPPGSAAVQGLYVAHFSNPAGFYQGSAVVDSLGKYTITTFSTGTYYARTGRYPSSSLIHEAYGGIPCSNPDYYYIDTCAPGQPAPITVVADQVTPDIDFELGLGRALSFRVTDENTGMPIVGARVNLAGLNANPESYTDSTGRASFIGLRTNYVYRANFLADGYRPEAFDNIPCNPYCQPGQGVQITFADADPYFRELAAALTPMRRLVVHVRDLPQTSFSAMVNLLHPSGQVAFYGSAYYSYTMPGWRSVTFTDPAPGSYYLQAGYQDASYWRLYPNVDCLSDCLSLLGQAQQIAIGTSPGVQEYFVDLRPFPSIEGNLVDAQGGSPVVSAAVYLLGLPSGGQVAATLDTAGGYRFNYARPGAYLVVASSPQYVDVAWPDATCTGTGFSVVCANATPIAISGAQSAYRFDFSLARSAQIGGNFTIEGAPTSSTMQMRLLRGDGSSAQGILTLGAGSYTLADVAPGSYRVVVEDSDLAYGQVYPGHDCAGADCLLPGLGTPVVASSGVLGGIDFDLRLQRGGKGRVVDAASGLPLVGVAVDMWSDEFWGTSYVRSALTGPDGRFAIPAPSSSVTHVRLATSAGGNYVNEVYNNVQCQVGPAYLGLCDILLGDSLPALQPMAGQGISFRLDTTSAGILFADGMED